MQQKPQFPAVSQSDIIKPSASIAAVAATVLNIQERGIEPGTNKRFGD
jgi:hypothetical protein